MNNNLKNLSHLKGGVNMRKKLAIILTIAMMLPMVFMALPASADYATYTTRLSGATRVETAVAVSVEKYPATADATNVVLARKDMFPDALGGGVLADVKTAPVLLTSSTSLDGAAKDEINRSLNGLAGTVYILGGTGAISTDVENAVKALDSDYTVTRISGADRYETAAEIAKAAHAAPNTYLIATGENFPDALAAAAAGALKDFPVLLVTKDSVPAATRNLILSDRAVKLIVIGGTAVVSDAVVDELATLTDGTIKRVSGADRYATAVEVAKHVDLWSKDAVTGSAAQTWCMARGDDFADALAGAILGKPLLLTQSSTFNATTESYLKAIYPKDADGTTSNITILGGTGAIAGSVERAVAVRVSCENWGTTIATPSITEVDSATNSPAGPSKDTTPDVKVNHAAVATNDVITLYDATGANLVELASDTAGVSGATNTTLTSSALTTDGTYVLKVKHADKYGNESALSSSFSYVLDTTAPHPSTIVTDNGNGDHIPQTGEKFIITFNEALNPADSSVASAGAISASSGVFVGLGTFTTAGSNTAGSFTTSISTDGKVVTVTVDMTYGTSDTGFGGNFGFSNSTITDVAGNGVVPTGYYTVTGSW